MPTSNPPRHQGRQDHQNNLFDQLKIEITDEWHAFCNHEFVRKLGDGSLPEPAFRHYLEQDYLFLVHFSRAWALAVYKSSSLSDMRSATQMLDALLNTEMKLHVEYCAQFGITESQLFSQPEARANMAYTRFVLERGIAGDILDLHIALAPCVIGYAEIAAALLQQHVSTLDQNPYADWIKMYSGDEYQQLARDAAGQINRLASERGGDARFDSLALTFRQATILEAGFWDMGLHIEF